MAVVAKPRSVAELAAILGVEFSGNGDLEVRGVRPLDVAGPNDLSFLGNPHYTAKARESKAGVLLVSKDADLSAFQAELLAVDDPHQALAELLEVLFPAPAATAGVHPTAIIGEGCVLDEGVAIGPYCVVGDNCRLGAGVELKSHVTLGEQCEIGEESVLHPQVVVWDGSVVGKRAVLYPGAVIGADGFGYASATGLPSKLRQVGHVVLGDDVEVGVNSAVDRATLEETRIGDGTKIDNLVQVGHNVQTGKGCLLCGQVGIAGSSTLGDHVVLAGQVGVSGHIEVGSGVQVAAKSAVLQNTETGPVGGIPSMPIREWQRQSASLRKLAQLRKRVAELERKLASRDD